MMTGLALADETLDYLKDDPVKFALSAVLKFKPIEMEDPAKFDHYKEMMEKLLSAA
jgi:hypothetical protein